MQIQRFPETWAGKLKLHFVVPVPLLICDKREPILLLVPTATLPRLQCPARPKIPTGWSHLIDKFLRFPGPLYLFKAEEKIH